VRNIWEKRRAFEKQREREKENYEKDQRKIWIEEKFPFIESVEKEIEQTTKERSAVSAWIERHPIEEYK
jgi:hypothetical protein